MDDSWLTVYRRFDPEEERLAPAWRVDRPKSPLAEMITQLSRRGTQPRWARDALAQIDP